MCTDEGIKINSKTTLFIYVDMYTIIFIIIGMWVVDDSSANSTKRNGTFCDYHQRIKRLITAPKRHHFSISHFPLIQGLITQCNTFSYALKENTH